MASEILYKMGTPICWADTTDYSSTGSGITRTAQIDLTSLATTKAREGARVDLTASRAPFYAVILGIEMDVGTSIAGKTIDVFWSCSFSGTAATGNTGGASGSDGAYKDSEEAEWVKQLTPVGSLTLTDDAATVVQRQQIATFSPPTRYGQPVVWNNSTGQAMEGDAVEMYLAFIPIIPEGQ